MQSLLHSYVPICLLLVSSPPSYPTVPIHEAHIHRFGGDRSRPKTSAFLDFYKLDGKGSSRFSQLNPQKSGMLSKIDNPLVKAGNHLIKVHNPLVIIKLPNLMSKYGTAFFRLNKLNGNPYAMECNSVV